LKRSSKGWKRKIATLTLPSWSENKILVGKFEVPSPVQTSVTMVESKESHKKINIIDSKSSYFKVLWWKVKWKLPMFVSLIQGRAFLILTSKF
jgi:hypothetical protein